jgi:hypothetical protein
MALLHNPYAGDDPDPEDEPETHADSCRCYGCEEERAIYGDDNWDPDLDDDGAAE